MELKPGKASKAILGVIGHAGAGHVHSHSGFIQEDSVGFAVAASLIRKAYPADTCVLRVSVAGDIVEVETGDGGIGKASARRGFSPYEIELMQRSLGFDSVLSQSVSFRCFGRIYGQGVLEAPVAFQTALCLAAIDTFSRKYPKDIRVAQEEIGDNVGACMGTCIDVDGIAIAAVAVLNATKGGIGPVEDLEGNIMLGGKKIVMEELGMDQMPTIIIENKGYIPTVSKDLDQDTFFVRYNKDYDNPAVGSALFSSCAINGFPVMRSDSAYPRDQHEMKRATVAFARRLIELGHLLEKACTAQEKTMHISELALLVSQDAGGINYMSEKLHGVVAAGGLMPGTAAVLSLVVPTSYIEKNLFPEISSIDVDKYLKVVVKAVALLAVDIENATSYLERLKYFDQKELEQSIQSTCSP